MHVEVQNLLVYGVSFFDTACIGLLVVRRLFEIFIYQVHRICPPLGTFALHRGTRSPSLSTLSALLLPCLVFSTIAAPCST